jgi:DNA-binding MarR family transcriptional regulator
MDDNSASAYRDDVELDTLTLAEGAAWGGLLKTYVTLRDVLDAELQETHGLPLTWYDVLRQLALASGNSLRLSDLADRILLTQSGLSRLIDRLEREELVCREPDPEDGRATRAVLTRRGISRLVEAHATHVEGIRRHFLQHLKDEELEVLADLWRRVGRDLVDADGK